MNAFAADVSVFPPATPPDRMLPRYALRLRLWRPPSACPDCKAAVSIQFEAERIRPLSLKQPPVVCKSPQKEDAP